MESSFRVSRGVRNRIGWRHRLARLRGAPIEVDLGAFDEALAEIGRLEDDVTGVSDERLATGARELRTRASADTPLDDL